MVQKQIMANQQQSINSQPITSVATTTSNNFVIAPDILQQINSSMAPPVEWIQSLQQQQAAQNPIVQNENFEETEQTDVISIPTTLLRQLIQLATSAKQS